MEVHLLNSGYMPNGCFADRVAHFFNDFAEHAPKDKDHIVPATDILEDQEGYRLYLEMPGVKSDSLEVRVEDGRLVVEAERVAPDGRKTANLHLTGRTFGPVRRAFRMPEDASHEGITAVYKDGILEVTVPKKPESRPTRIKVETR